MQKMTEKPVAVFNFKFNLKDKVKFVDGEKEFEGIVTGRVQYLGREDSYYVEVEPDHPANDWFEETKLIKVESDG